MRPLIFTLIGSLALAAPAPAQTPAPACTGLCLQQVSCPNGGTTTISGTVYTPNGTDPLPNVLVYIPNAAVPGFTPGVSCPVPGAAPPGSPLVGTTSAVDGSFQILNVPVGTNIPLIIQTGRWRRQLVVPATTACADTAFSASMPSNQTQGDIPKFAIATGSADQVECVLRKVGIADSEFTDPSGTGRINLYSASNSPGAVADAATPSATTLMGNAATLNSYDVLMLPCEGGAYNKPAVQLSNLIGFANAGGRVYSSHFSYDWMYENPPFSTVANWVGSSTTLPDGVATVDTSFADGNTLAKWLQIVGASTTQGQIAISENKLVFNGVNAPTQSYLTLNDTSAGNPVMQFVFDTPIATTATQCGRVLFNAYHVENPPSSPTGKIFPAECSSAPMTPQEKLLEYSLFELTNDGGAATLTPTTQDFGSVPTGTTSGAQTFTWTNNSTFPATVTLLTGSGDFSVGANACTNVAAGGSCLISAFFTPSALGPRTGTLTVGSAASTLTASLTGTGIPGLSVSTSSLTYGNVDVGAHASQTLTVTNNASVPIAVPPLLGSGDFIASSTCGATLAGQGTCMVTVTLIPSVTGPRMGSLAPAGLVDVYSGVPVALSGNGVDFSLAVTPGSGTVIAGDGINLNALVTPLAGFAAPVTLTCSTNAPATTCSPTTTTFIASSAVTTTIALSTTSQYTVIGFGGYGGRGFLWIFAVATGGLLWFGRRRSRTFARYTLVVLLLAAVTISATGCSGKQPAKNPSYTAPGTYTLTLSATDGFLVHSATYSVNVTAK